MKKRYYIIIAIASYLIFTLVNTPAATVISVAEKNVKLPVKFYGVQGSIWRGSSDSLIIQGQPPINNLQWSLNPFALLIASISADIEASIKQQKVLGHISVSSDGTIEASDVRAKLDASEVQQLIAMPFGELGGEFNLNIQSLEWQNKGLPITTGTLKWKSAKLTLAETVDLGNVSISVNPGKDKDLIATLNNKGGSISIEGTVSLQDNKHYKLDLQFTPEKNASEHTKQSLQMFAKRQSNGSYRFQQSGNLRQLGF